MVKFSFRCEFTSACFGGRTPLWIDGASWNNPKHEHMKAVREDIRTLGNAGHEPACKVVAVCRQLRSRDAHLHVYCKTIKFPQKIPLTDCCSADTKLSIHIFHTRANSWCMKYLWGAWPFNSSTPLHCLFSATNMGLFQFFLLTAPPLWDNHMPDFPQILFQTPTVSVIQIKEP
jgi:hypothetical protein